jgi:predicted ester cyclase
MPDKIAISGTPEQKKAYWREHYTRAWNEGAFTEFMAAIATDAIDHSNIPTKPPGIGPESFKALIVPFRDSFPDLKIDILQDFIEAGPESDMILHRWVITGTFKAKPLFGVQPNGRSVDFTGHTSFLTRGGLVRERWANFDELRMLLELGFIDPPKLPPPPK